MSRRWAAADQRSGWARIARVGGGLIAIGVWFLLGLGDAEAKPPTLTTLFPAGACQGRTILATASGTFDHWPPQVWVDRPGITIKAEKEKGSLSIRVAPDAEAGVYLIRLHDGDGATGLRPFVVGSIAETLEVEPNDAPSSPGRIGTLPITVNGRLLKNGDVDGFSVALASGQQLVADLVAERWLGSPMDGVMQVVSAAGFVLAQNDDTSLRDPRLLFVAPANGIYIVRLFAFPAKADSSIRFAGGPAFVYRLTLTTGGFIDYAYPLAVGKASAKVEAVGWNLSDRERWMTLPAEKVGEDRAEGEARSVSGPAVVPLAGVARVRRVGIAVASEVEPNSIAKPLAVADPVAISGRIDPPGDRDVYRFRFKKGDRRLFRVEARALGFPLDPALRLIDESGKVIFDVDDRGRNDPDVERAVTIDADGEYRVIVRDMNDRGGVRFAYLLTVQPPLPDYALLLGTDQIVVTPGKPTTVSVAIERKDGFAGSIEVSAEGLPDGVSARAIISKSGSASSRAVKLEIVADACACSGAFRVVGREVGRPDARLRRASFLALEPEIRSDWPWLTISRVPAPAAKK